MPRRSLASAAAIAPTPDTEAGIQRGREGPTAATPSAVKYVTHLEFEACYRSQ
jgi:hypothetical protein